MHCNLPFLLSSLPRRHGVWIIRIFWSVDIVMNFVTGFEHEGVVIKSLLEIWKRYARSLFLFDLLLVTADWAEYALAALHGGSSDAAMTNAFRMLRALKVTRVGRLLGARFYWTLANTRYPILHPPAQPAARPFARPENIMINF